jgi:hypothetical protein
MQNYQSDPHHHHHHHSNHNTTKTQKSLKFRKELQDYFYMCLEHKEISSQLYDYYMDFSPSSIRKSFAYLFQLNKLLRLVLLSFLFFHSIWWSTNSVSNNLAINYSLINFKLFTILIYLNFYEFLINHLLINLFLINFVFKYLFLISIYFSNLSNNNINVNATNSNNNYNLNRLRNFVNIFLEPLIYALIFMLIFYYLKVRLNFSMRICFAFLGPHTLLVIYNMFDMNFKVFNVCLFSNISYEKKNTLEEILPTQHTKNLNEYYATVSSNNNSSNGEAESKSVPQFVYADCSNMSINQFLESKISLPKLLTAKTEVAKAQQKLGVNSKPVPPTLEKQQKATSVTEQPGFINLNRTRFRLINRKKVFYPLYYVFYHIPFVSLPKSFQIIFQKRNTICTNPIYNGSLPGCLIIEHLRHRCEKQAQMQRDETDMLSFEFNRRLREIFIRTFESLYVNFFLIRFCLPQNLLIRETEYILYFLSSLICSFLSNWLHYMPVSLLVTMSRNADHMGKLSEDRHASKNDEGDFEPENDHNLLNLIKSTSVTKWSSNRIYLKGEKFSFMAKAYKVDSTCSVTVPNNRKYKKFYSLFSNPFRLVLILLLMKLLNLSLLSVYLILSRRWYAILTSLVEILFNCHTFFIILRDFFIFYSRKNVKMKQFNIKMSKK